MSVCSAWASSENSPLIRAFNFLVPSHLQDICLIWVPGHNSLLLNEEADPLARSSLDGPSADLCPVPASIAGAWFRRYQRLVSMQEGVILNFEEYAHLKHHWNPLLCESCQCEVTLTNLRCKVPQLNFYMHRSGLTYSALCAICGEHETLHDFLLHSRGFSMIRQRHLIRPLQRIGLPISMPILLSIGATSLGYCHRGVAGAIHTYVSETRRLPC